MACTFEITAILSLLLFEASRNGSSKACQTRPYNNNIIGNSFCQLRCSYSSMIWYLFLINIFRQTMFNRFLLSQNSCTIPFIHFVQLIKYMTYNLMCQVHVMFLKRHFRCIFSSPCASSSYRLLIIISYIL